jgi:transposase
MSHPTRWVGIDLHRRRSQIAVIDQDGELTVSKRVPTARETITELLGDPGGTHVALEATYGWEWLAELLQDAGYDVHLAHPLRTRAIAAARVKTDAIDAKTLAHLLRTGMLPEAYIAPPNSVICESCCVTAWSSSGCGPRSKNRVHALLARQGILPEHSDVFGTAGREYLAGLELPDGPRSRLDSLLSLIDDLNREIIATTRTIDARARVDQRVTVLTQIPGIGLYIAMLIIAEVGEIHRFPTARHLCAWAGLAPTVRSSDGKPASGTSPTRARTSRAGRSPKPPSASPAAADRCARNTNGSRNAAAAESRKSRSPARSSPSATTASGTARSAAWTEQPTTTSTTQRPTPHDPGHSMNNLRSPPGREVQARASSLLCLASSSSTLSRAAVCLIEPPGTARHPGPPSATGWMTGASSQPETQSANRNQPARAP